MNNFAWVILHYKTIDDTIECVDSILKTQNRIDQNIIIVDNGSGDNTGIELKNKYLNNKKIKIILSEKNLGFANGNNLGYEEAKKLNPDFIAVINNDMILEQDDFIGKVYEKFEKTTFYILGPDIISIYDKEHQNPQRNKRITEKALTKNIFKLIFLYMLNIFFIEDLFWKVFKVIKKNKLNKTNENWKLEKENIQLHGSCLIFSSLFIKKNSNAFYNKTFMFMEEDILYYLAMKLGYKTVYTPEIKIYHKEDSATNFVYKSNRKKRQFIYRNTIKSSFVLKNIMKNKVEIKDEKI